MKTALFSAALLAVSAIFSWAISPGASELSGYSKNLARHHLGANLLEFDEKTQKYVPTEAAAAWLDDDVATGWPAMPGKHYYLLALAEPVLITNFEISTRQSTGTINLFTSDQPDAPLAKSWTRIGSEIPVEAVNHKRLEKPFNRVAKYVLIETDLSQAGPFYSLYVYGDKPAVSYYLETRDGHADLRAAYGRFVNNHTAINANGLYANGRVVQANVNASPVELQQAIDDNPETFITIEPSEAAGLVVRLGEERAIQRVAVLAEAPAKGDIELFILDAHASTSLGPQAKPAAKISLDGMNPRGSVDFSGPTGSTIALRWVPTTPGQKLVVREFNSFGGATLATHRVVNPLEAIAALDQADSSKGDFKAAALTDPGLLEPVGELSKTPYIPGGLNPPPLLPVSP